MTTELRASLNKMILVAAPVLFGDTKTRRCRLIAAESFGLWLMSKDIARAVQPEAEHLDSEVTPAILVPFAQIAAVLPIVDSTTTEDVGPKPTAAAPAANDTKSMSSKAATTRPRLAGA